MISLFCFSSYGLQIPNNNKVVFIKLDENGNYVSQEDFITGWLSNESAWGRPVSPFVMSNGSLLISDDKFNVIYKVTYKG